MERLPPLKSLLAFRHAAQALSFKQAAEQLFVTQAAVSQQIKTLESYLGVKLFERRTREVVLTAEGSRLLPYVGQGFASLEQGVAALGQDPFPDRLTLSVLPSFAGRWLVPRLGEFQQQQPKLSLHLSPSLALASFEGSDLDLALRFGRGRYSGLESRLLLKEYLIPACHPSLIDQQRPVAEQLSELPLLTDDAPDMEGVWSRFESQLGRPLSQDSRLHVSDATMLVEALLSGQGFAMLRFSLAYELLQRGQLVCPLPIYQESRYDYYLVAPEAHFQRPKVAAFENWLRGQLEQIDQSWLQFEQQTLAG